MFMAQDISARMLHRVSMLASATGQVYLIMRMVITQEKSSRSACLCSGFAGCVFKKVPNSSQLPGKSVLLASMVVSKESSMMLVQAG